MTITRVVINLWLVLFVGMFNSCVRYTPIWTERRSVSESPFRMDGYYFTSVAPRDTSKINAVILFYQNGVFEYHNSYRDGVTSTTVEKELVKRVSVPRRHLEGYGYYTIHQKHLTIEYWTYDSHSPVNTSVVRGEVLNDTTLDIGVFESRESQLWYFMPTSIKPDSTTVFDEQLKKGVPIRRGKRQGGLGEF